MAPFTTSLANFLTVCSLASALDPVDVIKTYPTFLPVEIPVDRAFDLQWNPPGYPQLDAQSLAIPWGDRANDDPWEYYDGEHDQRTGQYTFLEGASDDDSLSFVRTEEDGSYVQVFQRVQFLLISEDVLMFSMEIPTKMMVSQLVEDLGLLSRRLAFLPAMPRACMILCL